MKRQQWWADDFARGASRGRGRAREPTPDAAAGRGSDEVVALTNSVAEVVEAQPGAPRSARDRARNDAQRGHVDGDHDGNDVTRGIGGGAEREQREYPNRTVRRPRALNRRGSRLGAST
jgi:hypothetical protein